MDTRTRRVYEAKAQQWIDARSPRLIANGRLAAFAQRLPRGAAVADLGCGPGWYAEWLRRHGFAAIALDATSAMLRHAGNNAPHLVRVQGDVGALPFRMQSLDGAWASACYQHLPRAVLPAALAHLHWALKPGAPIEMTLANLEFAKPTPAQRRAGELHRRFTDDTFRGRLFSLYSVQRARDLLEGAGFTNIEVSFDNDNAFWLILRARRSLSLPDLVAPRLRLLVCGLNPSIYSAECGVGFARPGNRFWPAMCAAGLVDREREPLHALARGIGMTDLVKRSTTASRELQPAEYVAGLTRVERLVRLYKPGAVCFVGLEGWRRTTDPGARAGWIASGFAGRPAYLMPSTSGRNASARMEMLVEHLRIASGETPRFEFAPTEGAWRDDQRILSRAKTQ